MHVSKESAEKDTCLISVGGGGRLKRLDIAVKFLACKYLHVILPNYFPLRFQRRIQYFGQGGPVELLPRGGGPEPKICSK